MTTNDPTSAGSVKAEETEGAKEGLGVGETCVVCGHAADAHRSPAFELGLPYGDFCEDCKAYADAHIEDTVMNPRHPYAPPSTPVRPLNPVPDQVLTPLSAQVELERIEADLMAGHAEGYDWVAGIDASALKRHREAVSAAIRAPLEAVLATVENYRKAHEAWLENRTYYASYELSVALSALKQEAIGIPAAALAGVPKEAVCDHLRDWCGFCGEGIYRASVRAPWQHANTSSAPEHWIEKVEDKPAHHYHDGKRVAEPTEEAEG